MTTSAQPARGTADLNTERIVAESVPSQIRDVQAKLKEALDSQARYTAQLHRLVAMAIVQGVELCPAGPRELRIEPRADNGNAASPGRLDGVSRGAD